MTSDQIKVLREYLDDQFERLAELIVHNNVQLLSVDATATILGIAPVTLRNYLSQGKIGLRSVKIGGRTLFKRTEVEDYIASL